MQRYFIFLIGLLLVSPIVNATGMSAEHQQLQQLIEQKKYQQAAKNGINLIQSSPANAQIHLLTGFALQKSGQISKAKKIYQEMISQYPYLPEAYNNLAIIEMNAGNIDRATELLQDAIKSNQSYATAYKNLDRIYTASAAEAYRRALSEKVESDNIRLSVQLDPIAQVNNQKAKPKTITEAKTATVEDTPKQDNEIEARLKNLVIDWARAWSQQNVDGYIDFYSEEFTQGLITHQAWTEHRRERIERARDLEIEIEDIQIRAITENRAIIDFKQHYRSRTFSDRVVKQLRLSLIDSQWKITDEQVL